jgi:hypothetical protein
MASVALFAPQANADQSSSLMKLEYVATIKTLLVSLLPNSRTDSPLDRPHRIVVGIYENPPPIGYNRVSYPLWKLKPVRNF